MCFSPEGDLAGGVVVTAIGIDAWRQLRGRRDEWFLAMVPLVLGAHLLIEAFVWWGLDGTVSPTVGRAAMWAYLLIAMVVVPVLAPVAIMRLEPQRRRRRLMAGCVAIGVGVAAVLGATMLRGPVSVRSGSYHLAYSIGLRSGYVVVGLYVVATCTPLLLSSYRHIVVFGVVNLAVVLVLTRLTADGFTSLWCFYAAVACGAISLHLRHGRTHRGRPWAWS